MSNQKSLDTLSVGQIIPEANERKLKKVPFVELADGRLQGVVSSGSDVNRVYVSFVKAGSHDYYCSTNNNRKCGGLYGSPCKHITLLLDEAIAQYGIKQVAQFLKIPLNPDDPADPEREYDSDDLLYKMKGSLKEEPASTVFSRFLNHLQYLELEESNEPLPEMAWFITESQEL